MMKLWNLCTMSRENDLDYVLKVKVVTKIGLKQIDPKKVSIITEMLF